MLTLGSMSKFHTSLMTVGTGPTRGTPTARPPDGNTSTVRTWEGAGRLSCHRSSYLFAGDGLRLGWPDFSRDRSGISPVSSWEFIHDSELHRQSDLLARRGLAAFATSISLLHSCLSFRANAVINN